MIHDDLSASTSNGALLRFLSAAILEPKGRYMRCWWCESPVKRKPGVFTYLLYANRLGKPEGLVHPLPVPSGTGVDSPLLGSQERSAASPPIAPGKDVKENHPVVYTTGIACTNPSGLKSSDACLVFPTSGISPPAWHMSALRTLDFGYEQDLRLHRGQKGTTLRLTSNDDCTVG